MPSLNKPTNQKELEVLLAVNVQVAESCSRMVIALMKFARSFSEIMDNHAKCADTAKRQDDAPGQ